MHLYGSYNEYYNKINEAGRRIIILTMKQTYLPGTIRDRLPELMDQHHMTQDDLAQKIGVDAATVSRFVSGKTDKIRPDTIVSMAKEFGVSTDFLLGVVNDPARKNYDIGELGLSVDAARNLYTGKINADVLNRLLTNDRFAETTDLIALYLEDRLACGVAAQNEIYKIANMALQGSPETKKDADEIHSWITNPHREELDKIRESFDGAVWEIKKEYGSDSMKETQVMSREITQGIYSSITKGQDIRKVKLTKEEYVDRICTYLSGRPGVSENAVERYRKAMLALLNLFGRKEAHEQSPDQ